VLKVFPRLLGRPRFDMQREVISEQTLAILWRPLVFDPIKPRDIEPRRAAHMINVGELGQVKIAGLPDEE